VFRPLASFAGFRVCCSLLKLVQIKSKVRAYKQGPRTGVQGGNMDITTTVPLTKPEINDLANILNCAPDGLSEILSKYAAAAMREYLSMFAGQKVFKRGSDILEYRLFLMVEEAFGNLIPDENLVSSLFQTTTTESRSLIRAIMSKYQYQLKVAIECSLQQIIRNAHQASPGDPYTVVINSQNLVDELNVMLSQIDGSLPLVSRERGSVSTYVIQVSSYKALKAKLH
jgi:hypothetical protein